MPALVRLAPVLLVCLLATGCSKTEPEPAPRSKADTTGAQAPRPEAPASTEAEPEPESAAPEGSTESFGQRMTAPRGVRSPPTTPGSEAPAPAADPTRPPGERATAPVTPAAPVTPTGPEDDSGEADNDDDDAPVAGPAGSQTELRPPPKGLEILPNNRWNISRKLADRWEENPYRLAHPHELDTGWKLRHIKPGGPGWYLGLRNGDVLLEVNGMKLNTMPQLLAAYLKLKNKTDFDVKLSRNGKIRHHHYHIVD